MINGFNPVTGVFPEPPNKENNYKGLPIEMIPRYKEQAKQLYDLYEAGGWPRDILNAVLNPKPAGDKSDSKRLIGGQVGDGVMCLYAAISLYRPRSEKYKRSLKRAMCKAHLAFRSGDPRKHVADLEFNMTEILSLGVRLPWDETGLEIIGTLGDRGTYESFLHPYRDGGADPDDCAPYLQKLFAEIINAADAQNDRGHREAKGYKAFSIHWNENEGLCEVVGGETTTNTDEGEGGENFEDNYYDDYSYPDLNAYDTYHSPKGKGGFGKGGYGKGGKGKGKGSKGVFGKGGKGMPFNPSAGGKAGGKGKGGDAKGGKGMKGEVEDKPHLCAANNCANPKNAPFSFCSYHHQQAKKYGKLTLKDGRVWQCPQQRHAPKRAYDTMLQEGSWVHADDCWQEEWHDDSWWQDSYDAYDTSVQQDTMIDPAVQMEMARQVEQAVKTAMNAVAPVDNAAGEKTGAVKESVQARLNAMAGPPVSSGW